MATPVLCSQLRSAPGKFARFSLARVSLAKTLTHKLSFASPSFRWLSTPPHWALRRLTGLLRRFTGSPRRLAGSLRRLTGSLRRLAFYAGFLASTPASWLLRLLTGFLRRLPGFDAGLLACYAALLACYAALLAFLRRFTGFLRRFAGFLRRMLWGVYLLPRRPCGPRAR